MARKGRQTDQQLVMLTVLFAVLLHMPLLGIFNLPVLWQGIPALFLYVFAVWAVIILATAWLAGRKR